MEAIKSLIKQGYNFQIINGEIKYTFLKPKEANAFHFAQIKRAFQMPRTCANYINTLVTITIDSRLHVHIQDCSGGTIERSSLSFFTLEEARQKIQECFIDNPKYDPIVLRNYRKSKKMVIINQDLELMRKEQYKYVAEEVQQIDIFD